MEFEEEYNIKFEFEEESYQFIEENRMRPDICLGKLCEETRFKKEKYLNIYLDNYSLELKKHNEKLESEANRESHLQALYETIKQISKDREKVLRKLDEIDCI